MAIKLEAQSSFERNAALNNSNKQYAQEADSKAIQKAAKKNSHKNPSKGAPWGIIIFFLILFFPIGIGLMVSKLHKDTGNYVANGKSTAIVGWIFCWMSIFALVVLMGASQTTDSGSIASTILTVAIFCGSGYALIRHGNKYKAIGLKCEKYLPYIANSRDGALERIATYIGEPYETVYADIQSMIDIGALPGSYIDVATKCVVSPPEKKASYKEQASTEEPKKKEVKKMECLNCGGINTITGDDSVCEFCGAPLE